MKIPEFKTDKELFTWLKDNEEDLIYEKKSMFKKADAFSAPVGLISPLNEVGLTTAKSNNFDVTEVKVRAVINTTMIRDSHKDVHISGLWKKSLQENTKIKHLQEHEMRFDKIIADKGDLKAFTKTYDWKQLGYDIEGKTEALVFDSVVKQSRNPIMFNEYKNQNVDNHSVGMYYINMKMAMDTTEEGYESYKAEFDKHIDQIANKEEVKRDKFFFAIYEAKVIEGSAVPIGSNQITPTLNVGKFGDDSDKTEAEIEAETIIKWLRG